MTTLEQERVRARTGPPPSPPPPPRREPRFSLVGLVKEFRDETTLLFRQEVELARREMQEKIDEAKRNFAAIAAGAMLMLAGGLFVLYAASAGLFAALVAWGADPAVAVWLAPLIVGIIVLVGGWLTLRAGRERLSEQNIKPEKTLKSLRDTGRWAKERATS